MAYGSYVTAGTMGRVGPLGNWRFLPCARSMPGTLARMQGYPMEKIGQRVKQLRAKHKITQRQLACLIGCGQASLHRLECDEHLKISLDCVLRMAAVFDVTMDYLCSGVDHDAPKHRKKDEVKLPDAPRNWFDV